MNTFKNFIYNISDILVALLIIAAAVLIIGWRVNTIMDYPDKIAAVQTETKEDNAPEADRPPVPHRKPAQPRKNRRKTMHRFPEEQIRRLHRPAKIPRRLRSM